VMAFGDIDRPVYPRSAVKALQALPLIESGAADRLALSPKEIALACASHSGESEHVATARAMLTKAGRNESALECGAHWPLSAEASRALARSGETPSALHNNCSGKHAGFICVACATDTDPKGYVRPEHAIQRRIKGIFEEMMGVRLADEARGVDGCSIPTYATPLSALARAFARFGTGVGLSAERAAAAQRLREAVAAEPFMVAGTGRFDAIVMQALRRKAFTKTGAEGVYCATLPDEGLGIAIKCDDGAGRAAEAVMAATILTHARLSDEERKVVAAYTDKPIVNWNGIETGRLRVKAGLLG